LWVTPTSSCLSSRLYDHPSRSQSLLDLFFLKGRGT
ncbi:hypothetical protein CSUI_000150, partial [Cystoisospora suis]